MITRCARWLLPLLVACVGSTPTDDTSTAELEACALAAESQTCPECSSGDVTCTYGDTSVTAASCGDCQARAGLYQALCDAGVTDTRAAIEAGTVCGPPTCVAWLDACSGCVWQCVPEDEVPATTCDLACPDTGMPDPGVCAHDGTGCAFQ